MTYTRLPYEDASTTAEMCVDCMAVESNLAPHAHVTDAHSPLLGSTSGAHGYSGIEVSDSLAELAAGLHLHFD